jgi:hypothetical protein
MRPASIPPLSSDVRSVAQTRVSRLGFSLAEYSTHVDEISRQKQPDRYSDCWDTDHEKKKKFAETDASHSASHTIRPADSKLKGVSALHCLESSTPIVFVRQHEDHSRDKRTQRNHDNGRAPLCNSAKPARRRVHSIRRSLPKPGLPSRGVPEVEAEYAAEPFASVNRAAARRRSAGNDQPAAQMWW